MKKSKFVLRKDPELVESIKKYDKKTLAIWARDCAERVMHYFEEQYPQDNRPRKALETLQNWINTGEFKMAVIRKASLDAHAAAKEIGNESPAASAAHAAGQAVATAHVYTHSIGPGMYALQAIHRASNPEEADANVEKEKQWQYKRLIELGNSV